MKRILSLLTLLMAINLYSQLKLEGIYCSIPFGEGDVICVDFQEDNRFEYKRSGCLGLSGIGKGTYELKRSTLKLVFDKMEQSLRSKVTITEKPSTSDPEVVFEFNIKDQHGGPIFVLLAEKGDDKDIGIDSNGKITLPKSNETVSYKIYTIGYETLELSLRQDSDKVIDITLFEFQPKPISGQIISWELSEIKADMFKTGKEPWPITYRKVQR